jgi:aminoglycoside phosphotransferase (APT) family kinase protein
MSIELAQQIIAITPMLGRVEKVEYLDKGFSTEKKYVLWEDGAPAYLLRLGEVAIWQRQQADFGIMRRHHQRGVLCSEPHISGVTEDGTMCYLLLGYIPGRNAEEALPEMAGEEQFRIGLAAGRELRKLHELACPDEKFDWAAHRRAKYHRRVRMLEELGLTFASQRQVEEYVECNQRLLDEAPVCFQHDDFHPSNLIISDGKLAGSLTSTAATGATPGRTFINCPGLACL